MAHPDIVAPNPLSCSDSSVESAHPAVAARILDARTPEGDLQVEVSFCGRQLTATGSISSAVTLHTDSPRRPDVNVLVQAHFRTPVTVTPQAVVVASDESGEVVKSVTISGLRPIQVEAVRGPAAVRTTLVQDSPSSWRIEVRFPADTPLDGPNTALTFNVRSTDTTDAAEARAVAIPLHRLPPSRRGVP